MTILTPIALAAETVCCAVIVSELPPESRALSDDLLRRPRQLDRERVVARELAEDVLPVQGQAAELALVEHSALDDQRLTAA